MQDLSATCSTILCNTILMCVCVCVMWLCVLRRADSDRAAPHANAAYNGKGVPSGHAGRASAGPQYCACYVPLPGPVDQDTFPFPGTASHAMQQQPSYWIQPQLHDSPDGRHTIRAGDFHAFLRTVYIHHEIPPSDKHSTGNKMSFCVILWFSRSA